MNCTLPRANRPLNLNAEVKSPNKWLRCMTSLSQRAPSGSTLQSKQFAPHPLRLWGTPPAMTPIPPSRRLRRTTRYSTLDFNPDAPDCVDLEPNEPPFDKNQSSLSRPECSPKLRTYSASTPTTKNALPRLSSSNFALRTSIVVELASVVTIGSAP